MKREIVIDGKRTKSLETFFDEFSRAALDGTSWGRNLDAFNDVLRGGFGTPEGGFTLRWQNSAASRDSLDYPETVRQLQLRLERCHPTNQGSVGRELADAERGLGPTVFDWLVEIIAGHGPGGEEAESNVRLILD
jgi:RNAse (barnase) inhibitor barstar